MYDIVAAGFILLSAVCVLFVQRGVRVALQNAGLPAERTRFTTLFVTVCCVGWVAVASGLALSGVLSFSPMPPSMGIVLIVPLVVLLPVVLRVVPKSVLAATPAHWLVAVQSFRIGVEVLLWGLHTLDLIPVQMSFEGRNWDILVGLTAPVVAYFCFIKQSWSPRIAIAWNIVGLALLLNIVAIAVLSMPLPFRVFMNEPANTIVAQFPFVLLPAVLVPMAYTMHILSLRQLLSRQQGVGAIQH